MVIIFSQRRRATSFDGEHRHDSKSTRATSVDSQKSEIYTIDGRFPIMTAQAALVNFNDFVLWRVALGLDSVDAIRLSRASRDCHRVIEDSPGATQIWSSMLEKTSVQGILMLDRFWLHALMQWPEIARYREQTRRFMSLCELRFNSISEMMKLLDSINLQKRQKINRMISGLHDPHIFLGEWRIPTDSILVLKQIYDYSYVVGLPVQFETMYGCFSVALQLSMLGVHTYRLSWQVNIPLETRMEAYSFEIDVSGTLAPDGEDEVPLRIHSSFDDRHGGDGEEFGAGVFTEEDQVYKTLIAGRPLKCFARIAVSSTGERCSVKPS